MQQGPDLALRREELLRALIEAQLDLGGLAYEMAIRNAMRPDLLVARAASVQVLDAELQEVERMLRAERTGAVGSCAGCGAPHSGGAAYCWQCGSELLQRVGAEAIARV
ncbi:MAG TPA: hypothetical protein VKU89_08375 [Solirubrobacteraceae bacterium]|nr:hypothetical protein [Solirubrobacteraceae bacterium]